EMMSLQEAAERFPDRVRWVDFYEFLGHPEDQLLSAMGHIGIVGGQEAARRILSGPAIRRYAKAQQFEFDARARAEILRQSQEQHAAEISKGEEWVHRAADAFPTARKVLDCVYRPGAPVPNARQLRDHDP